MRVEFGCRPDSRLHAEAVTGGRIADQLHHGAGDLQWQLFTGSYDSKGRGVGFRKKLIGIFSMSYKLTDPVAVKRRQPLCDAMNAIVNVQ